MATHGWITPTRYDGMARGRPRYSSDRRGRASGLLVALVLGALVAWLLAGGGAL